MLLVACYPQTTTICLRFLSTHTDMDDFERHVIIHLVMRSVALVCMMLLPLYLAMPLLLLPVFVRHEFCHLEGVMHSTVASKSNQNEQHSSVVKYSSDPFLELCRPHKSGASQDVTWVVRRRLTVLRRVEGEDRFINTLMESMCSFVACVPK